MPDDLLAYIPRNADVEKATAEFERTQAVEEKFNKDFDGVDFTKSVAVGLEAFLCDSPRFRAFHGDVRQDFALFSLRCAWRDCVLQQFWWFF
jgi:hypothetical protein